MTQALIDPAIALMNGQHFSEALQLLRPIIDRDPSQWYALYMAGQCCRFLNDINVSIEYLSQAAELKNDEPPILLALGIVLQMNSEWEKAIGAFEQAIEIDPDYVLAYNSLALTQKMRGELDKAIYNYDAGVKALARRIAKGMRNYRTSPILKTHEMTGALWVKYAGFAALYLACSPEGIKSAAFPTAETAMEEERTEKHSGLYWIDEQNDKNETVRKFLPNFFNTFLDTLKRDATYSILIGNRGTALKLLGQHEESRQHLDEAAEFKP